MSALIETLNTAADLTIASDTWLEVSLPPLARWYWLQVDGPVRLQGCGETSLTDGDAYTSGGMKLNLGDNTILPLPASIEAKSLWISGDGGATTGRIFTSLDRMSVT
jgi:hypothetical protein